MAPVFECLERVLSSHSFEKSPRQQDLLRYLVKESLAGNAERLKGYTLGVELFGRGVDFDPTTDAIVRVEVGRLRTKLREYYQALGKADDVQFDLPKGGYQIELILAPPKINQTAQSPATDYHSGDAYLHEISLAVLPFSNLTPDTTQEHLVDGIVDNVIFELSRLSGLFVISRQSSFRYRGMQKSCQEIGRELGVCYLLEGSIQSSAGKIRVTVKLIKASQEKCVWAERFDSSLQEIFALQDEITLCIVKALQVRLSPVEAELFGHEGTESVEAHDALLRGMACHWKYSPKPVIEGRIYFTRAVELDPNYASARAWLARNLLFLWVMHWDPDRTLRDQAMQHAQEAVRLNPKLSYAHSMLGWAHLWCQHRDESISHCREAVGLDPNNAEAHLFLSMSLSCAGFGEEALFYIEKAMRFNPLSSPFYEFVHGLAYYVTQDFEKAIAAFKRGCALSDTFPPNYVYLCTAYAFLDMEPEMLEAREKYLAILGGDKSKLSEPPWTSQQQAEKYNWLLTKAGLR